MNKTDLYSALLFLMLKLEELKKAYEIKKDSLANMANSPWVKLVMGMLTSKMQADKVDAKLPDVDALIKESTSDEYINKKIKDILGE